MRSRGSLLSSKGRMNRSVWYCTCSLRKLMSYRSVRTEDGVRWRCVQRSRWWRTDRNAVVIWWWLNKNFGWWTPTDVGTPTSNTPRRTHSAPAWSTPRNSSTTRTPALGGAGTPCNNTRNTPLSIPSCPYERSLFKVCAAIDPWAALVTLPVQSV